MGINKNIEKRNCLWFIYSYSRDKRLQR